MVQSLTVQKKETGRVSESFTSFASPTRTSKNDSIYYTSVSPSSTRIGYGNHGSHTSLFYLICLCHIQSRESILHPIGDCGDFDLTTWKRQILLECASKRMQVEFKGKGLVLRLYLLSSLLFRHYGHRNTEIKMRMTVLREWHSSHDCYEIYGMELEGVALVTLYFFGQVLCIPFLEHLYLDAQISPKKRGLAAHDMVEHHQNMLSVCKTWIKDGKLLSVLAFYGAREMIGLVTLLRPRPPHSSLIWHKILGFDARRLKSRDGTVDS